MAASINYKGVAVMTTYPQRLGFTAQGRGLSPFFNLGHLLCSAMMKVALYCAAVIPVCSYRDGRWGHELNEGLLLFIPMFISVGWFYFIKS